MKRIIIVTIVLLGLGLVGWSVYQKLAVSRENGSGRRKAARVAVEVRPVETAAIFDIREFTGTLVPRAQFVVAPKIAGRLKKLMFDIGDRIRPGALIALLDDEEYVQQVDQAKAELQVVRANQEESRNSLEIARREFERTVVLRSKKIASESELDSAESNYQTQEAKVKVAMAQVVQKEAALKAAQVRLSYTRIKAPQNGDTEFRVIGERYVHEGAMLAANTPIVSILDIQSLVAAIHVIERDYAIIRPGMKALVSTDAFPGRRFAGRIIRMAPLLKEKSREARVEIEIANNDRLLKPGMFVRVQIEFGRRENATLVPVDALAKREGQPGVFLVDTRKETVRFVPVTTGIVNGNRAEIANPPLSGMVVTLGHHLLEDGAAIILPDGPAAKPQKPSASQAAPEQTISPGTPAERKPQQGNPS